MITRSVYNTIDGVKVWKTKVTLVDQEQFDKGPFNFGASYCDGTLNAVIDSLVAIRDSIPEEYRDSAQCDIDSESGYEGSHYAHIEVTYYRPETEAETQTRIRAAMIEAETVAQKERAILAQLKAKYEEEAERQGH